MARLFNDASSEYLQDLNPAVTAAPFVLAGWFTSDSITTLQTIVSIGDKDVNDSHWSLFARGATSDDPVGFGCAAGGSTTYASTTPTGYTLNKFHHACGISASATDRRVFIDGGSKGTNITNLAPTNVDNTCIGRIARDATFVYFSGAICQVAIWDLSLWPGATGTQKADLFEAVVLPQISVGRKTPDHFPLGLVRYWPLGGLHGQYDWDIRGRTLMTAYNTPTWADHPPGLIYPRRRQLIFPAAAAPAFAGRSSILGGGVLAA